MKIETKAIITLILGRIICAGFGPGIGVLYMTWAAAELGQLGLTIDNIAGTVGAAVIAALFGANAVIKLTADRPYLTLAILTIADWLDIAILIMVGPIWPWAVIYSGAVRCSFDMAYILSRRVLINRAFSGDKLTKISAYLDTISAVTAAVGTGMTLMLEPTILNLAILSGVIAALLLPIQYYQIKYLSAIAKENA